MPGFNRLYIGANRLSVHGGKSGVTLGPNLLSAPNGPFASAPWTIEQLTETTGQVDPLGGTTASLLTDNVTNAQHRFFQPVLTTSGQKMRITAFYKPGTFANGFCMLADGSGANGASFIAPGTATVIGGQGAATITAVANGFYQCTFTWNVVNNNGFFIINFGQSFSAYAGSSQNQTFWGTALQTST